MSEHFLSLEKAMEGGDRVCGLPLLFVAVGWIGEMEQGGTSRTSSPTADGEVCFVAVGGEGSEE